MENNIKIAVFSGSVYEFECNKLFPKEAFKRIKSDVDLIGKKFNAVILLPEFQNADDSVHIALGILTARQPELFKKV